MYFVSLKNYKLKSIDVATHINRFLDLTIGDRSERIVTKKVYPIMEKIVDDKVIIADLGIMSH